MDYVQNTEINDLTLVDAATPQPITFSRVVWVLDRHKTSNHTWIKYSLTPGSTNCQASHQSTEREWGTAVCALHMVTSSMIVRPMKLNIKIRHRPPELQKRTHPQSYSTWVTGQTQSNIHNKDISNVINIVHKKKGRRNMNDEVTTCKRSKRM